MLLLVAQGHALNTVLVPPTVRTPWLSTDRSAPQRGLSVARMMAADVGEQRLHTTAHRAIKRGAWDDAQRAYEISCQQYGTGQSFLLAALHHRRMDHIDQARDAFSEGILRNRGDAKLMQAWGLFESKHGHMDRAVRLLRRAVDLDPSLSKVLSWRMFQTHATTANAHQRQAVRPTALRARGRTGRSGLVAAMAPEATLREVRLPSCAYTVKVQNLGWRGRAEQGEDPKMWYDSEGERKGPPMNYWRQAADERYHAKSLAAIDAVARGAEDAEEQVAELERKMGIAKPLLCRKLLGRWAPVLAGGVRLAAVTEGALRVPATLEIRRSGERRTMENRYGVFDAHLDDGEELRLALEQPGGEGAEASLRVSASMEGRSEVSLEGPASSVLGTLGIGRITFLGDYLWVQRDADGVLMDVWMSIPDDAGDGEK
eukprot:scaffold51032_cov64-Phaeocystis_antarctica.AAC.6